MIGEVTKLYKLQNNLVMFFIVPCKHSDQTQTYNRDIFMSWLKPWPRLHLAAGPPVIGVGTTTSACLLSSWLLINAAILLLVTSAMVVVWGHQSVFVDSASWRSHFTCRRRRSCDSRLIGVSLSSCFMWLSITAEGSPSHWLNPPPFTRGPESKVTRQVVCRDLGRMGCNMNTIMLSGEIMVP